MPSQRLDDLHLDRTPSLSLEVLELNLENKELYRVRPAFYSVVSGCVSVLQLHHFYGV